MHLLVHDPTFSLSGPVAARGGSCTTCIASNCYLSFSVSGTLCISLYVYASFSVSLSVLL